VLLPVTTMPTQSPLTLQLFHPRLWITWLWFALWYLITLLPYRVLLIMGAGLGLLLYKLPTRRKQIALTNIQLCFSELDSHAQSQLLKENFVSMGIALMEVGMAWWWPKARLQKLLHFEGLEHLAGLDDRGVIMLGIHHTTIEISGAALSSRLQLDAMYRAHNNPVYEFLQVRGRLANVIEGSRLLKRDNVRETVKSLKSGRNLWYLPDHDYGIRQGLFAPFFGVPAATVYTTARFARKTNAAVVPFSCQRLPGGKGYHIRVHPPLNNFPTGDDLADATRINQIIEKLIAVAPEQYLWAHRRFKNRPSGEPAVYNFSADSKRKIK